MGTCDLCLGVLTNEIANQIDILQCWMAAHYICKRAQGICVLMADTNRSEVDLHESDTRCYSWTQIKQPSAPKWVPLQMEESNDNNQQ